MFKKNSFLSSYFRNICDHNMKQESHYEQDEWFDPCACLFLSNKWTNDQNEFENLIRTKISLINSYVFTCFRRMHYNMFNIYIVLFIIKLFYKFLYHERLGHLRKIEHITFLIFTPSLIYSSFLTLIETRNLPESSSLMVEWTIWRDAQVNNDHVQFCKHRRI